MRKLRFLHVYGPRETRADVWDDDETFRDDRTTVLDAQISQFRLHVIFIQFYLEVLCHSLLILQVQNVTNLVFEISIVWLCDLKTYNELKFLERRSS